MPDDLSLTGGLVLTGIDATLHPNASISGAVTLPAGAQTDADVAAGDVAVYVEVLDTDSGEWVLADDTPNYVTGSGGNYSYSITGLSPDNYKLYIVYSSATLYGQHETPTPITVLAGSVNNVPLKVTPVGVLDSGTLVKTASSPTIYLVDGESNFIPVLGFDQISAMGLSTAYTTVPADEVIPDDNNGNTISSTPLSSIVNCFGDDYLAGSGELWPVSSAFVGSLPVTPLADDTCSLLTSSGTLLPTDFSAHSSSSATIWYLDSAGHKDAFTSWQAELLPLQQPPNLTVASSFLSSLVTGPNVYVPGTLLSFGGPTLYMVNQEFDLLTVGSLDVVTTLGYSTTPISISPSYFSLYTVESGPLVSILSCQGSYYIASPGGVHTFPASLVGSLPTTPAASLLCTFVPGNPGGSSPQGALFVKSASDPTIWWVDASGVRHAMSSIAQMNSISSPYAATFVTVPASFISALPIGPVPVYPGELITSSSGGPTYLVDGTVGLIAVPSVDVVSSMGLSGAVVQVSSATISAHTIESSSLGAVVSCSGADFVAGSAKLWPIASVLVGSLPVTVLDPSTCAVIPKSSVAFNHALFVKSASNPAIYYVDATGHRVAMSSFAQMASLSTPDVPNYITVADSFLNSLPIGPTIVTPGELVKTASNPAVYLVDGASNLIPVAAFDEVSSMGLSTAFVTVTPTTITSRTIASSPLGTIISCSGSDYVAGSGKLWPIASALVGSLPVTVLDPTTCAVAPKSSQGINHALFVKSASNPAIYYVDSLGRKDAVHSFATITQLSAPDPATYLVVAAGFVAALPQGPDVVPAGSLVKSSAGPAIYLVDGSGGLIPVSSFSTISDMGLSTAFITVAPAAITGVTGSALTNLVSCGGQDYVAGSGKLWPISPSTVGSLPVSVLAATLCAVIPTSSVTLSPALIRSATSGAIYNLVGGQKTALTMATLTTLLAGQPLVYANVNNGYLATIPNA